MRYLLMCSTGAVLLAAAFGAGSYFPALRSAPSAQAGVIQPVSNGQSLDEKDRQDIQLVISTFLNQLAEGHIEDALAYTTGDTRKVMESNQGREGKLHGSLLNHAVRIRFSSGKAAQAEVDATVKMQTRKDRNHYLYSLIKEDSWKIYKIDELPVTLTDTEGNAQNFKIPSVISSYLGAVAKGDWKESAEYLTGQALEDVQKTASFLPRHMSSTVRIIRQTVSAVGKDQALILTEYEVTPVGQKKSLLKTMFCLENADGEWKISNISTVEEKHE